MTLKSHSKWLVLEAKFAGSGCGAKSAGLENCGRKCLAGITLSVQADFLVGPWEGRLSLLCTTGVGSKGWTMMVFITVFSTLQLNHLTEENSSNFYLDAMFLSPFMYLFCSLNSCSWSAYYMPGSETQHLRDSGPVSDGEINGYL